MTEEGTVIAHKLAGLLAGRGAATRHLESLLGGIAHRTHLPDNATIAGEAETAPSVEIRAGLPRQTFLASRKQEATLRRRAARPGINFAQHTSPHRRWPRIAPTLAQRIVGGDRRSSSSVSSCLAHRGRRGVKHLNQT